MLPFMLTLVLTPLCGKNGSVPICYLYFRDLGPAVQHCWVRCYFCCMHTLHMPFAQIMSNIYQLDWREYSGRRQIGNSYSSRVPGSTTTALHVPYLLRNLPTHSSGPRLDFPLRVEIKGATREKSNSHEKESAIDFGFPYIKQKTK